MNHIQKLPAYSSPVKASVAEPSPRSGNLSVQPPAIQPKLAIEAPNLIARAMPPTTDNRVQFDVRVSRRGGVDSVVKQSVTITSVGEADSGTRIRKTLTDEQATAAILAAIGDDKRLRDAVALLLKPTP